MISAPSEIRCRSMPMTSMTAIVMARTSGTVRATTMPVRQPSVRRLTTMMIASASTREFDELADRAVDHPA